jgi:4-hydroxybenzoate polyprenyltransferase
MKKIIDLIVYSNFFIAFCVALFTWQTLIIFPVSDEEAPVRIIINFISTFVLYNLQRLYYSAKLTDDKYSWYNANRRLVFTLIILLLGISFNFMWHFFANHKMALVAYAVLSLLSLLYFLPPFQLRRFGVLKPFLIALVFVFIGIAMPIDFLISNNSLLYIAGQFAFITALCVLFDIRDVENDKKNNTNTFPVKYGEVKTKIFVGLLLLIYLGFSLAIKNNALLVSSLITFIISAALTFFANSKKHNLYYAVLVDGTIILQAVLMLV